MVCDDAVSAAVAADDSVAVQGSDKDWKKGRRKINSHSWTWQKSCDKVIHTTTVVINRRRRRSR